MKCDEQLPREGPIDESSASCLFNDVNAWVVRQFLRNETSWISWNSVSLLQYNLTK